MNYSSLMDILQGMTTNQNPIEYNATINESEHDIKEKNELKKK